RHTLSPEPQSGHPPIGTEDGWGTTGELAATPTRSGSVLWTCPVGRCREVGTVLSPATRSASRRARRRPPVALWWLTRCDLRPARRAFHHLVALPVPVVAAGPAQQERQQPPVATAHVALGPALPDRHSARESTG